MVALRLPLLKFPEKVELSFFRLCVGDVLKNQEMQAMSALVPGEEATGVAIRKRGRVLEGYCVPRGLFVQCGCREGIISKTVRLSKCRAESV